MVRFLDAIVFYTINFPSHCKDVFFSNKKSIDEMEQGVGKLEEKINFMKVNKWEKS